MRAFAILLTYPLAAMGAELIPQAGSVPDGPWTAGVWRMPTDGDVFFAGDAINASGGKFWVNKETSAYCPGGIEGLDCSALPGSKTVFVGGNDTLSLDSAPFDTGMPKQVTVGDKRHANPAQGAAG